jgi:hypothetical protein
MWQERKQIQFYQTKKGGGDDFHYRVRVDYIKEATQSTDGTEQLVLETKDLIPPPGDRNFSSQTKDGKFGSFEKAQRFFNDLIENYRHTNPQILMLIYNIRIEAIENNIPLRLREWSPYQDLLNLIPYKR